MCVCACVRVQVCLCFCAHVREEKSKDPQRKHNDEEKKYIRLLQVEIETPLFDEMDNYALVYKRINELMHIYWMSSLYNTDTI